MMKEKKFKQPKSSKYIAEKMECEDYWPYEQEEIQDRINALPDNLTAGEKEDKEDDIFCMMESNAQYLDKEQQEEEEWYRRYDGYIS